MERSKTVPHRPVGQLSEPTSDGSLVATFGFGSNSVRQLRGRLCDPALLGYPARIPGQALAFAGPNRTWAHDDDGSPSGTATLIPMPGEVALGTMCFLSEQQLETLDGFEGRPFVYDRREFHGEMFREGAWHPLPCVAYTKQDSSEWYPPSQAYRCAVFRNLRGSFPSLRGLVLRDTSGAIREQWCHPGHRCLNAGAFLFEVGVRKTQPWILPRAIGQVKVVLQKAASESGIKFGGSMISTAAPEDVQGLLQSVFQEEELGIALRLLGVATAERPTSTATTECEWSDDEAQAEQAPAEDARLSLAVEEVEQAASGSNAG